MQQFFLNVVQIRKNITPPVENMDAYWNPMEKEMVTSMTNVTFLGSKETIRQQMADFQEKYKVNEIMAVSYIYDPDKQKFV